MRKSIIIAGVAICIICTASIFGVIFTQRAATPSQDLTISDYPKLLAKEVDIVIGKNASQQTLGKLDQNASQIESVESIAANLENLTGNKPEIANIEKFGIFKYTHNLIILSTPNPNKVLEEVYNTTDATRVTNEYLGVNTAKNNWSRLRFTHWKDLLRMGLFPGGV